MRDNGIGIDPKYADKIFGLFQRLHDLKQYEGNGIGLALCRTIVQGHGGRIWVESEPTHRGCTFCFSLPVHDDEGAARTSGETPRGMEGGNSLSRLAAHPGGSS